MPSLAEPLTLRRLRNIGKAALADLHLLGITTIAQLQSSSADELYSALCTRTQTRHDPCVHDVFAAAIHEANTGEPVDWWAYTPHRKARQIAGTFPQIRVHQP